MADNVEHFRRFIIPVELNMVLPNFLIIGAMKSGTTSLWHYLNSHPDIFMSFPKEPGFFVKELTWRNGWDWYEGLFAGAGESLAVGEASTHYTKYPTYQGVAERIASFLPSMKFIYFMREPVARAVSHYWHCVHYEHETRSMLCAIKDDPQYVAFSSYATQLEQYLSHFPREQFLFSTFERLKANPRKVVRECFEFLGVDPDHESAVVGKPYNEAPDVVRVTRGWLHRLRWSPCWDRISPFVPRALKKVGKRLEFTSRERPKQTPDDVRAYLTPILAEENERLFALLETRFLEWEKQPPARCNQSRGQRP